MEEIDFQMGDFHPTQMNSKNFLRQILGEDDQSAVLTTTTAEASWGADDVESGPWLGVRLKATMYLWGSAKWGQLGGSEATGPDVKASLLPRPLTPPDSRGVVSVAAGDGTATIAFVIAAVPQPPLPPLPPLPPPPTVDVTRAYPRRHD